MPIAQKTTEQAHNCLFTAYDRRTWKEFLNDEKGWEGRIGGWIYDESGAPVEQGYQRLYLTRPDLREEYRKWLAGMSINSSSFRSLLPRNSHCNYRPTIRERTRYHRVLADEYDAVNNAGRTAYRGHSYHNA